MFRQNIVITGHGQPPPTTVTGAIRSAQSNSQMPSFRGGFTYTISISSQQSKQVIVTRDDDVRGGVPCVGLGRWPVVIVLKQLAVGHDLQTVANNMPGLTFGDVQSALAIAAWIMREPKIDWSTLDIPAALEIEQEWQDWESASDQALNSIDQYRG